MNGDVLEMCFKWSNMKNSLYRCVLFFTHLLSQFHLLLPLILNSIKLFLLSAPSNSHFLLTYSVNIAKPCPSKITTSATKYIHRYCNPFFPFPPHSPLLLRLFENLLHPNYFLLLTFSSQWKLLQSGFNHHHFTVTLLNELIMSFYMLKVCKWSYFIQLTGPLHSILHFHSIISLYSVEFYPLI